MSCRARPEFQLWGCHQAFGGALQVPTGTILHSLVCKADIITSRALGSELGFSDHLSSLFAFFFPPGLPHAQLHESAPGQAQSAQARKL